MPTLANKRKEYLDETYDEDLNPLEEPEEYKADAPVKRVDSHQRSGFAIIDPNDSLQNRAAIDGNTYGVGDYVEGLGNIEDIDQYGNPTILPDDPEQPAYRLGQSEVGPEGKAEEPEEAHMSGPARDYPSMGEFMAKMARISGLAPPSWLKPGGSYQGEEPDEEDALAWIKDNSRPIEPEEEELQHMVDNVYAGLTDDQVSDAVEKDHNDSTAIDGTYSSNEDGSWTQDYTRPDGQTITLKGYGEGDDEYATANVTGLYQ